MQALRREWRLAGASGAAFLLAVFASDFVVHHVTGLTAIWPANAVTLALLLLRGRTKERRFAIAAGAFAGSLLSSILRLQPLLLCLLFPVVNTAESLIAAAIVRARGDLRGPFTRLAEVNALILACLAAPLLPATFGAAGLHVAYGADFAEEWLNWYGAALLGLALVTPAVVLLFDRQERRDLAAGGRRLDEAAALLGLVAAVALFVFTVADRYAGRLPLLFLILPCVTLAAFRMRQAGAVAASVIVTVIGAQATVLGFGPFAKCCASAAHQLVFLQLFLATTFLTALPVAAAIAERDRRAREARLIAEQFRTVVENVDKPIVRVDQDGLWTYLNPAWEEVTGHAVAASLGRPWHEHAERAEEDELADWARPVLVGEIASSRRLIRLETAHLGPRWMELSFQALHDENGDGIGAVGTMRDVDDRKRMEDHVLAAKREADARAREATVLAATDELTGLANRRAFSRHLQRQLEAITAADRPLALAIFDVDHFKSVNDGHGHAVGDRVLQRVAARALGVVRSGDVVGRLGGEEFGIIMAGAHLDDAQAVAERLRLAIQAPPLPGEEPLPTVTVSVGIAAASGPEPSASLLGQEADRALYAAKRDGRNRVKIAA